MSSHNQYEGAATNNAHDHTVGSAAHSDAHIEQGKVTNKPISAHAPSRALRWYSYKSEYVLNDIC